MKKLIALICLIICLFTTASAEGFYLRFGNIVDLEWDSDCVTADDGIGNLWEFYGCDEFFVADLVVMVIADNETPENIYDDHVIQAFKCTYEEAQEIIEAYKNFFQFPENTF